MENPHTWFKPQINFFLKILIIVFVFFSLLEVNLFAESPENSLENKKWYHYLYLGLIYEDLGRAKQAISAYRQSLNLDKNTIALFRLAKIYRKNKEYQKASDLFQELINYDSSLRLAYYYLGQCLKEIGQNRRAYKYLTKAVSFYPGFNQIKDQFQEVKQELGKDFFEKRKREKKEKREKVTLAVYKQQKDTPLVKVGIAVGVDQFSFFSAGKFEIKNRTSSYFGKPDTFYTIRTKDNKIFLSDYKTNKIYSVFSSPVTITSRSIHKKSYPFYILDVTYGVTDFWHKKIDRAYRGNFKVVANEAKITLINIVSIEEYLYGVLAAEIPPYVGKEALKAQAILARSLAIRHKARHSGQGFDFCADVHCQVYHGLSAETPSTKQAVDATRGEIIIYKGEVPEIFYHSNCGGCLTSDVFGQKQYLADGRDSKNKKMPQSAAEKEQWFLEYPDAFCSGKNSKFRWQRIYDQEDFRIAFGAEIESLEDILPRVKKGCFRHSKMDVILGGKLKSLNNGLEIRRFFDNLRSSAFNFEVKKDKQGKTKKLIFWGAGFGHGTGLCQEGAIGMAKEGYIYSEILKHYYPGVLIKKQY